MQGGELARLNLVSNLRNSLILNSSISGGLTFRLKHSGKHVVAGFSPRSLLQVQERFEACEFSKKGEFDDSRRAVALLRNEQLGKAGVLVRRFIDLFTVNEHHEIRILFDRTRFTQVRKLRLVITLALFGRAAQLR